MACRRAAGASIMFGGAGVLAGAAAMATLAAASDVRAGTDMLTLIMRLLGGWTWPAAGVVAMLGGRLVYGHWHRAAPIAFRGFAWIDLSVLGQTHVPRPMSLPLASITGSW